MVTTQETASTRYLMANGIKLAYCVIGPESPSNVSVLFLNHYLTPYDDAGLGHSGGDRQQSIKAFSANQISSNSSELIREIVISGSGLSGTAIQSAISGDPPNAQAIADAFFQTLLIPKGHLLSRIFAARSQTAGKDGESDFKSFLTGPMPIHKDALVTTGANDLIVPSLDAYALSRQLCRTNLVIYPGSGHSHLFWYTSFFVKQVNGFLNREWTIRGQLNV
ncbi:hypothetical protein F5884DRAFT_868384 [Xylogone sp. PMI_703]|nr:hypothetical protein F5884DRAFT_868384 [Xylogone sp. PMI_703]